MAGVHAIGGAQKQSAVVIDVQGGFYENISTANVTTGIYFNSNGTVGIDGSSSYNWRTGGGSGSEYEVIFEGSGGAPSFGTEDVWLSINTTRSLGVTQTTIGQRTWTGDVAIRRASDGVELDRATITLKAQKTS
jgi:hypothetical protein